MNLLHTLRPAMALTPDITVRQVAMLAYLAAHPEETARLVKNIAAGLDVAKPVISRSANFLGACGLTKRVGLVEDRRLVRIDLTPKGQKLVLAMEKGAAA
jgi:DNA-binding MarR family transcriptional regulator